MALATLTRAQLRQRVAGTIGLRGLLTGTASGTQSATTLVDTSADGVQDSAYPAQRFDPTAYLAVWGGATSTAFEWSRLFSYAPSTGTLTIGRNFATTPVTAVTPWELHTHGFTPDELHDALNWACRSAVRPVHWILTGLLEGNDGGMEAAGVTNWTGSSCTPTKTTTEANVGFGEQSLVATNSGAGGYLQGAAQPVYEGEPFLVFGFVKVTTGIASLVWRDLTNGADITVSWANLTQVDAADGTDWRFLIGTLTTPSGCVSVAPRLTNTSASGLSYWDDVAAYPLNARTLPLPTWLTDPNSDVYDLLRLTQYTSGRRDGDLTKIRPFYYATGNPTGQTAWVQPIDPVDLHAPITLLAGRGFTELASDTSTVPDWAGDWLITGALSKLYEAGARPRGLDAAAFAVERQRVAAAWFDYCGANHPQFKYGRPVRSRR